MNAGTPLAPKLRFPEFCDAGHWRFQPFSDLAEPISDKVGTTKCVPMSITTGVGLVSQEEKFGRIIAGDSYKNYIRLQTNDFAYNKSATKQFPQGYIARYSGTKDAAVPNSIFTCFRLDTAAVIPEYIDHLFHGNHHGRYLRNYITVGARAHGALSVSDDDLMSMPVPLPPVAVSRPEQRKVADCLGSLDCLIAAEGRKLKTLRQHKQGLMQQLFPRPGETAPRLRFPEFRDAGEWDHGLLKDFVKSIRTGKLDANAMVEGGKYRFYTCAKNYYWINDYAFDGEALLIAGNGAYLGYVHHYTGKFNAYQRTYVLQNFEIDVPFLKSFLDRKLPARIQMEKKDGNTPYIVLATIADMPLLIPPTAAEQQRIADCLGSLDARLAAQSRKLDTLKQHKQGLMQRLFPSPEGR